MKLITFQPELVGKKVTYQYKPTKKSRKWRNGFMMMNYTEIAFNNGLSLQKQEGFYQSQFVKGYVY